jgi:hypothetical protein
MRANMSKRKNLAGTAVQVRIMMMTWRNLSSNKIIGNESRTRKLQGSKCSKNRSNGITVKNRRTPFLQRKNGIKKGERNNRVVIMSKILSSSKC